MHRVAPGVAASSAGAVAAPVTRRHATRWGLLLEEGPDALLADHATWFIVERLTVRPGDRVAEPGCGTGMMSVCAARAGAASVVGTDIDTEALTAARQNAELNGATHVSFVRGSLLEPVRGPLDLVVALLPHKPGPRPFNPRYYGGPDGTDLLVACISQAADRLVQGGRLVLYVNSIANPRRVADVFAQAFAVRLLGEKRRDFTREEFEGLTPGMFAHLEAQRARGEADYAGDDQGLFFMARLYEGCRR